MVLARMAANGDAPQHAGASGRRASLAAADASARAIAAADVKTAAG